MKGVSYASQVCTEVVREVRKVTADWAIASK